VNIGEPEEEIVIVPAEQPAQVPAEPVKVPEKVPA